MPTQYRRYSGQTLCPPEIRPFITLAPPRKRPLLYPRQSTKSYEFDSISSADRNRRENISPLRACGRMKLISFRELFSTTRHVGRREGSGRSPGSPNRCIALYRVSARTDGRPRVGGEKRFVIYFLGTWWLPRGGLMENNVNTYFSVTSGVSERWPIV